MSKVAGGKTRVRPVRDGRVVRRRCEECDEVTDWVECDMLDRIELFEVSLLDMKTRAFVCVECGDDVHPDEVPAAATRGAGAAAASSVEKRVEKRAEEEMPARSSRDVAWISTRHVGPHHPEIDEEIAAMKRRLGKPR